MSILRSLHDQFWVVILRVVKLQFFPFTKRFKLFILLYFRLYAIYLIIGEMTAAKFLWKRIPVSVKSGDEMKQLWKIGCKLWTGDLKTVYELIQAFNWSPVIEK